MNKYSLFSYFIIDKVSYGSYLYTCKICSKTMERELCRKHLRHEHNINGNVKCYL